VSTSSLFNDDIYQSWGKDIGSRMFVLCLYYVCDNEKSLWRKLDNTDTHFNTTTLNNAISWIQIVTSWLIINGI